MNWREEAIKAVLTFFIFVGGAFALTADNPVNDWRGWAFGVLMAGSRAVVSQLVGSAMTWLARKP